MRLPGYGIAVYVRGHPSVGAPGIVLVGIYGAHQYNTNNEADMQSAAPVSEILSKVEELRSSTSSRMIVGGDLNQMAEAISTQLAGEGITSVLANEPTFPASQPTTCLDFIFTDAVTKLTAKKTMKCPKNNPWGDHIGLQITLPCPIFLQNEANKISAMAQKTPREKRTCLRSNLDNVEQQTKFKTYTSILLSKSLIEDMSLDAQWETISTCRLKAGKCFLPVRTPKIISGTRRSKWATLIQKLRCKCPAERITEVALQQI
jgi:hypothetical protein